MSGCTCEKEKKFRADGKLIQLTKNSQRYPNEKRVVSYSVYAYYPCMKIKTTTEPKPITSGSITGTLWASIIELTI